MLRWQGILLSRKHTKKQSEQAIKIARELSDKIESEEERARAEEDRARQNPEPLTPEQAGAMTKELLEYRRENSLADAIDSAFLPSPVDLSTLVAPVPMPEEKSTSPKEKSASPPEKSTSPAITGVPRASAGCFREVDSPAQVEGKRTWKSFAAAEGDLVVDLPDNVCQNSSGYVAASEGIIYSISPIARPSVPLSASAIDDTLNTLARTFAGVRSNIWLGEGAGNTFEMKLISKEQSAGAPRKLYAYVRLSCSVRKESVFVVLAAKAHFYTIDISGASESDSRVQRFLGSLKVG